MISTYTYYTLYCEDSEYQILRYTSNVCGCSGGNCEPDVLSVSEEYFYKEELPKIQEEIDKAIPYWSDIELVGTEAQWLIRALLDGMVVGGKDIEILLEDDKGC